MIFKVIFCNVHSTIHFLSMYPNYIQHHDNPCTNKKKKKKWVLKLFYHFAQLSRNKNTKVRCNRVKKSTWANANIMSDEGTLDLGLNSKLGLSIDLRHSSEQNARLFLVKEHLDSVIFSFGKLTFNLARYFRVPIQFRRLVLFFFFFWRSM